MAWINYREFASRFTHIDAEWVSASVILDETERDAKLIVRFYPWWEHPSYLAARTQGKEWSFRDTESGKRDVTVRAINPITVSLRPQHDVTDWAFSTEHPLLWEFSESTVVYTNGPFDVGALVERILSHDLPFVQRDDVYRYLDPLWPTVASRGISLPWQLQSAVLEELSAMGVPTYAPHSPIVPPSLVVLSLNDCGFIIAKDFELDVPEFIHDPAWFDAEGKSRAADL